MAILQETQERRELEAQISATPPTATVKGMYIEAFLRTLNLHGLSRPTTARFVAFKDYPLRDFMRMLIDACPQLYPDCGLREALKLQGRLAYPTLTASTAGKVIFAIAGRSWESALQLASRAWEISLKPGSATLVEVRPHHAVLALRDIHNFADTFQVGVLEGAMEIYQIEGTVVAQPKGRPCDVDLLISWY